MTTSVKASTSLKSVRPQGALPLGPMMAAMGAVVFGAVLLQFIQTSPVYGGSDTDSLNIEAIKAKTDNLPDAPASEDTLSEVKTQVDKSMGESPIQGATIGNWNAAEVEIFRMGAAGERLKIHSLIIDIAALTVGATVTIRIYRNVNGNYRNIYNQAFVVGTSPDGLWVIDGTLGIDDYMVVTGASDNAADDGAAIGYDCMYERM